MRSHLIAWFNAARAAAANYRTRLRTEKWHVILELSAVLVLGFCFTSYLGGWWDVYKPALTDPNLQTDDARTALFAFHRYAKGAPLANDPIANEMIQYQPHAFRLIYWVCVPLIGLLAAAKVAQLVCLAIIVAAGVVLAQSRRAGLGTAALFVFLFLRDGFVMDRVGGGLPRSFGFPAIAMWMAGALAHSVRTRRAGAVIAALTYPSALAMVLGAEGLYTLRRFGRPGFRTTLRRVKHYLILVATCALLFAPTPLFSSGGGPVHTLAQAREEPAFSKAGRLWVLPLPEVGTAFGKQLFASFKPLGDSPIPKLQDLAVEYWAETAAAFVALLLAVPLIGLSPAPATFVAFMSSSVLLYALSVFFAFKLYSPERYYSYGMHATAIAWVASAFGLVLPRLRNKLRGPVRNLWAAFAIFALWTWLGTGNPSRRGMAMTIDYRQRAALWEFIHQLPPETRIASFITDGDDIPLFTQRANNGGYETLQPWLTLSWARQKARAEDTLRAFYTSDPAELLTYTRKYKVTHLLVNRARYRGDFVKRALTFEPLSSFARDLLSDRDVSQMILAHVPPETVIYEYGGFELVSVKRLERLYGTPTPP